MTTLPIAVFLTALLPSTIQNTTLTVDITGFKSNEGNAIIFLQDASKKTLKQTSVKIENKVVQVTFENVTKGNYAVRMYHDENDNKKLDTGFMGIPTEGWGNSNNVKPMFGGPKFTDMIFELREDQSISITVNY